MPTIVPAEVNTFLTQQSLAALLPAPPASLPATTSGMTPIGAVLDALTAPDDTDDEPITDDTRFWITPKGEAALAACKSVPSPRPACPLCGSDVWKVYERFGMYESCDNADCYYVGEASPAYEVADADCDYERNFERRSA